MGVKIGNTTLSAIKRGSTTITKVYRGALQVYPVAPLDPDAQAFLDATGITNPTIESAINTLVLQLKSDNIWNKMRVIYPFVGGTINTNKYNLKNPLNTDAAFRLTFENAWGFGSNGVTNGGASSYANTHWIPSAQTFAAGVHMSTFKDLSGSASDGYDMGAAGGGGGDWALINRFFNNNDYWSAGTGGYLNTTSLSTTGFVAGSTGSTTRDLYDNGVKIATDGVTSIGGGTTIPIYFSAANNNGTPANFDSGARYSFATIGEHLIEEEMIELYNAIVAFNTTLGR